MESAATRGTDRCKEWFNYLEIERESKEGEENERAYTLLAYRTVYKLGDD